MSGKLKLLLSLEVVYKRVWISVAFIVTVLSQDHVQVAKLCRLLVQGDLCCLCLVAQRCSTLYDPMDSSLPGSFVHVILQARMLEWFAISFSRGSSRPRDWTCVSCVSCITGRWILYHWATWEALTRSQKFLTFGRWDVHGSKWLQCWGKVQK